MPSGSSTALGQSWRRLAQVPGEEVLDALPGVGRGGGLRTHAGHPEQWTQHPRPDVGVVGEGVPSGRMLLDVMDEPALVSASCSLAAACFMVRSRPL